MHIYDQESGATARITAFEFRACSALDRIVDPGASSRTRLHDVVSQRPVIDRPGEAMKRFVEPVESGLDHGHSRRHAAVESDEATRRRRTVDRGTQRSPEYVCHARSNPLIRYPCCRSPSPRKFGSLTMHPGPIAGAGRASGSECSGPSRPRRRRSRTYWAAPSPHLAWRVAPRPRTCSRACPA